MYHAARIRTTSSRPALKHSLGRWISPLKSMRGCREYCRPREACNNSFKSFEVSSSSKVRTMIAIIDYGMGNLRSVQKGLERVGFDAVVTREVGQIQSARGVVLPGVGAFSACMENLSKFGLIEPIRETVRQKKPFLGICLGFQLLFSESEEFGKQQGLDLFPGKVLGFHPSADLKVPHMGWNRIV